MSLASNWWAPLLVAVGGAAALSAPATAEPEDTGASAQSVIDGLKADGYNVEINWLTGYETEPLSVCTSATSTTPTIRPPPRGSW
jgi:hypothetical protein